MQIKDIMSTNFVRIRSNDSLFQVLTQFSENAITSAPVFEDDDFVGIVSVKSITRKLSRKPFINLWVKEKVTPHDRLSKMNAGQLSRSPWITLHEDEKVTDVLVYISGDEECIPVFSGKRVAGLLRPEDIRAFLLQEFAKASPFPQISLASKSQDAGASPDLVDTAIDSVLDIVRRKKVATAKEIAAELGISQKSVEKLGETLAKHKIIKMDYSFLSGATLRLVEDGKRKG